MITGLIDFNEKNCVFKLDVDKFVLEIEEIEERENQSFLSLEFIFNGKRNETILSDNLLIGKDFENDELIHFVVRKIDQTGPKTYTANLSAVVKFNSKETFFDGLQIQADELNWFHNIAQAYERIFWFDKGETQVQINPFEKTTENFEFNYKSILIYGSLTITTSLSRPSTSPIKLNANLNYFFKKTDEISFAKELIFLTYELLKFITYRKNFKINAINITKKDEDSERNIIIGQLYINNYMAVKVEEEEKVVRERIIDYLLIREGFPKLLEKISQKSVYLTHIPESSEVNRTITPERFIMATAGFEWQIRFSHKDKSDESEEKYRVPREETLAFIDEKIEINTGREKKYFKALRKFVNKTDSSLSEKLLHPVVYQYP